MSDSTKRKITYNPHDLPGYQKQFSCQTRPRKLSYSADDLNNLGIDDTNVEQILSKRPETIFNIHELVCSILHTYVELYIVKPVLRGHPSDQEKVAF